MDMPVDPLFAAGFASGAMLFWLLAAGIPIAIHLLSRRQKEHRQWAAMQLLLEVLEKESKRIRFEQLLLLALRILILILLALSLARPFFESESSDSQSEGNRPAKLWIIAVDASYSMAYVSADSELSQFEKAKQRAIETIHAAQTGDAFWIVELGNPVRLINQSPTFSRDSALAELTKLQQLHTGANLVEGLQLIEDLASQADGVEGLPENVEIMILSDLGEDSWLPALQGTGAESLDRLAKDYRFQVVSYKSNASRNVAIDRLGSNRNVIALAEMLNVEVSITNVDTEGSAETRLTMLMDDKLIDEQEINLRPAESQLFRFTLQMDAEGEHVITARIGADSLSVDNERRYVVTVKDRTRILTVADQIEEARLYETCLNPPGLSERQVLDVKSVRPTKLALQELSSFDAILVANCEALDETDLKRIARYVEQGGGVVFLLGPRNSAEKWNEFAEPQFGFRLGFPSEAGVLNIDPLDYESPIAKPFLGFPDAGLITSPVFKYWDVDLADSFRIDLGLSNQATFVASRRMGDGKIILMTSAPDSGANQVGEDSSWNVIAAWPSFVPLMDQVVEVASQPDPSIRNVLVGQMLRGTLAIDQPDNLSVIKPDESKQIVAARIASDDSLKRWSFRQTQFQGLYELEGEGVTLARFAANVDTIESKLRFVTLPGKFTQEPIQDSQQTPATDGHSPTDDYVARWLLLVLLGLVISESAVARWIGRRVR